MSQEIERIQQLEERREKLSNIIGQRESLAGRIGTGTVQVRSSFEATVKVGRLRETVRECVVRLSGRLEKIDQELELHAVDFAREHLEEVNLRRNQLAEISGLVLDGYLTEDDLRYHHQQFEELVLLPQRSTLLQKGIDKIKQREGAEKREGEGLIKEKIKEPFIEILPDGKVRLPNGQEVGGKIAELLILLNDTSDDSQKDTGKLGKGLYPEDDDITATNNARSCIARTRKRLIGTGVELVSIIPDNISKVHGEKASHFLREEKPFQPVETATANGQAIAVESSKPVSLSKVDAFIQELPLPWEQTRSLFEKVRDSEDFRYVKDVARRVIEQKTQTSETLRQDLAGYLFEAMVHLHLQEQLVRDDKILLSPSETFEVYCQLMPARKKIIHRSGLQKGIEGISLPDGIVFGFTSKNLARIEGICEYSLSNVDKDGYRRKLVLLDDSRIGDMHSISASTSTSIGSNMVADYIFSIYPKLRGHIGISENPKQYTVLPEGVDIPLEDPRVETVHVPVTTDTFRKFLDAFMIDVFERQKTLK